jgi:hypothetical protein
MRLEPRTWRPAPQAIVVTATRAIAIAAFLSAASVVGGLQWQARSHVVTVGFWFDDRVSFDLPHLARVGGPLADHERETIRAVARAEVVAAFEGLRVAVSDRRKAFYRVSVVQLLTIRGRAPLSGQSNVFGPLGGVGSVSFETLASQAISHAPDRGDRAAIVTAMGRGIGRAAVHEFAHQMLPHVAIHAAADPGSYEYWSSDRPAQFYGPMRWDIARPFLQQRFGN